MSVGEGRRARPHYEGDPKLFRVMVRPRWIAALLLALVVAGVFAWLGRWQLDNAIRVQHDDASLSETARPIAEVTKAGAPVTDRAAGMVVTARGELVPGDFLVVEERTNGGKQGAWATGHFSVDGGGQLPVAIGWAPTAAEAQRAIERIEQDHALAGAELSIAGRYMPPDGAAMPKAGEDPRRITAMTPAQLINLWAPFDGPAYAGFLVLHPGSPLDGAGLAALGLDAIDSVPPLPAETVNWLNLFYAAEWIVFAGFAVFFWYRLARDDWEKIHELMLQLTAEAEDPASARE